VSIRTKRLGSIAAAGVVAVTAATAAGAQASEQRARDTVDGGLVDTINRLEQLPSWSSTAVIIAYDDSDGWYDHQMSPIANQSDDSATDALTGKGQCGKPGAGAYPIAAARSSASGGARSEGRHRGRVALAGAGVLQEPARDVRELLGVDRPVLALAAEHLAAEHPSELPLAARG
jgi:hypothetical protein